MKILSCYMKYGKDYNKISDETGCDIGEVEKRLENMNKSLLDDFIREMQLPLIDPSWDYEKKYKKAD